jgi:hypothetical protein
MAMTTQDPGGEPTRVDTPAADRTMAMPATAGGPPPPGGRPPSAGPPDGAPDRRWWILAALLAAVILIGVAALLLGGDDDESADDTTTTSTTVAESTSSSATSSTTTSSTTTTSTTSTTTPPATVDPALCVSGEPDDPDSSVQVLYEAYTLGDRDCAEQLATDSAVDTLFAIPGGGGGWTYQGCTEQDEPDPHLDCAYSFTGGATHFRMSFSDTDGWVVYDVEQTTD